MPELKRGLLLAWLDGFLFDSRLALRGLRRDRAFTASAIAMLALAIGLNATVFAVTDAILFRGYPHVKRNDRLVFLQERGPSGRCCMSYADFEEWRAEARSFEAMAYVGGRPITLRDSQGRPVDMRITTVSANTFDVLGVTPFLGRDFVPADEEPGAPPVVILNHRFWTGRFAGRADIVGSTVHIDGLPATVIGVMPERFDFPLKIEGIMWQPVTRTPALLQQRGLTPGGFTAVARLRDDATLRQARAELDIINRRLQTAYPTTNRDLAPTFATHSQMNSGQDAAVIWGSLWIAAGFVLIIACANLANLTLVRTIGRWREFATKIALGAGQARMIRQIAIESLALASVAAVIGWWITKWTVRYWAAVTESQYQVLDYVVDARTLAYLIAISGAAAIMLALAPTIRVMQVGTSDTLKGDARGVTQGRRGKRLAAGLVAGQMALAIVLLAGAGVLVRSFIKIVGAETGVRNAQNIVVGLVRLPSAIYPAAEDRHRYFERLEQQLRTVPGVADVSVSSTKPVVRGGSQRTFEIGGRTPSEAADAVQFITAGSNYFNVVGAAVAAGRAFDDRDRASTLPVAIVNESFVTSYWPNQDPIGQRLRTTDRNTLGEWRVVVGVVPNIMQGDALRQQFKPLVYVPFAQEAPARAAYFFARSNGRAEQIAQAVRAQVEAIDPDAGLENFGSLDAGFAFDRDFMDAEHSELGKHAKVAPVFAVIALILAAIGLVAVIAHSVSQRTKEIGVRLAIGAAARDISRMVLREGMGPVAIGLIAGLAASLAVNRLLQSQLVGVSPYDPITMAGAPLVLAIVALVACQIPARRAMRVDPVVALRHE